MNSTKLFQKLQALVNRETHFIQLAKEQENEGKHRFHTAKKGAFLEAMQEARKVQAEG